MPPLPAELDVDPEPLGQLPDGSMGTLIIDQPVGAKRYGKLAVRYNTLRGLYHCVRDQVNTHKTPEICTNGK